MNKTNLTTANMMIDLTSNFIHNLKKLSHTIHEPDGREKSFIGCFKDLDNTNYSELIKGLEQFHDDVIKIKLQQLSEDKDGN